MNCWLIPCNVKNFDIVRHFDANDTAFFKKNRALAVGDIVYIYVASPYSSVRYKGEVIRTGISSSNLPDIYQTKRLDGGSYIEVRKTLVFPENLISRETLQENGVGQVVNQQSINGKALDYLLSVENAIKGGAI